MEITLNSEVLDIRDDKLKTYFKNCNTFTRTWSAFENLLQNSGAYNVDYVGWENGSETLQLTVYMPDKVEVLTVLREYIKNIIILSSIQEGQCFRVNHPNWDTRLKMFVKRIYKNGTVSLKSLSIGYKEVTVKLNDDNFNEYQLTKTKW